MDTFIAAVTLIGQQQVEEMLEGQEQAKAAADAHHPQRGPPGCLGEAFSPDFLAQLCPGCLAAAMPAAAAGDGVSSESARSPSSWGCMEAAPAVTAPCTEATELGAAGSGLSAACGDSGCSNAQANRGSCRHPLTCRQRSAQWCQTVYRRTAHSLCLTCANCLPH